MSITPAGSGYALVLLLAEAGQARDGLPDVRGEAPEEHAVGTPRLGSTQ